MVVQRNEKIPLWGQGTAGKMVFAELEGTMDSAMTGENGAWYLELDPMEAGGPFDLRIACGSETLHYGDIYVGDVWIASGQSNMAWTLENSLPPDSTVNTADNPEIRHFTVSNRLLNDPTKSFPAGSNWKPANTEFAEDLSAVGYYFSKYLYDHLGIPIGIINTSYGGTRIESWMSREMLGFDEKNIVFGDGSSYLQPTLAYNAMLHPLLNVRIKGFIWYQGESNGGSREEAVEYSGLFKKMIISWRELWDMGDLPFLWVQLASFNQEADENSPGTWDAWPLLRQSQSSALELANTGEAIAIDVGEVDIHPVNKQPVGERLSRLARKIAYNDTIPWSGPRYKSNNLLENGKVEISFDHHFGGLDARDTAGGWLKWFSLVKENGSLVRANAVIDSNKVVVWNDAVSNPLAFRYAWETNPPGVNFYNDAGLPAAPFFVYAQEQGLRIRTYTVQQSQIDRGESTIIRWEALGADSVSMNGIRVDPVSALRVWPVEDSVFVIKAFADNQSVSRAINISVRQPYPKIEIIADCPGILPTDSTLLITAVVSKEGGAPINKVEFFMNNRLVETVTEAPFELKWTADTAIQAMFQARAHSEAGMFSESNQMMIDVRDLEFDRFEAEDAVYLPKGRVWASEQASNGAYLELFTDWSLSFDTVFVPSSGPHLLYIRYLLNYGLPKLQYLLINGMIADTILFTAPDQRTWMTYLTTVPLDSGMNRISLESAWDYMSFDYVLVGKEPGDSGTYQTSIFEIAKSGGTDYLNINCRPNPFSEFTHIELNLPEMGYTVAEIRDITGRLIYTLVNKELSQGRHSYTFFPWLQTGAGNLLILHVKYSGQSHFRKLMVVR